MHHSDVKFVTACLEHSVIPRGLMIEKTLQISNVDNQKCSAVWERTLNKASKILLRRLKIYHKKAINDLDIQIKKEKAGLSIRIDFIERLGDIYQNANSTF